MTGKIPPSGGKMNRIHLIGFICWSTMALAPLTIAGSTLSASAGADFLTNGVIDCLQTSGGGLGTVDAPLVGCPQAFGQSVFQSTAQANAAFRTLRVLGTVNYSNLSVPSGDFEITWFLRADADITDTLTIPQGSLLDVTIDFSGTESHAAAIFFIDGQGVPYSFPGPNTFQIPFEAGVPFAFNTGLRVDLSGAPTLNDTQGQSFARFVDLTHTVQIVSTQVLDSQGNPLTGSRSAQNRASTTTIPWAQPGPYRNRVRRVCY
jgi:hypothetical protein